MRGRSYFRHTVYHTVDNRYKINQLNDAFKSQIINFALEYIKSETDMQKKVEYLKGLTHDTYRYGKKYKYSCNLSNIEISGIIKAVNDDSLYMAYVGNSIKESNAKGRVITVITALILFLLLYLLSRACSS